MAFRAHLVALRDADLDDDLAATAHGDGVPFRRGALGPWRVAMASTWALPAPALDWRLARATRREGGVALRASTVDDGGAAVALFRDGRRLAVFDHRWGGLRADELTATDELDDEVLARLEDGESLPAACASTTADLADRLTATLLEAGVEADPERLLAVLRGEPTGRVRSPAIEDTWVDVPDLLAAMGVPGVEEWLLGLAAEDEDETADDEDEDAPRRTALAPRLACCGLALLAVAGGIAGGVVGARTGGGLATIGGVGLGVAIPFLLVLLVVAARFAPLVFRIVRGLFRRRARPAPDAAEPDEPDRPWARQDLTRHLDPETVPAVRLLLADWNDVATRLRDRKTGVFAALYGDALLPADPGGRALVALLRDGHDPTPLAARVAALRLRLLDADLAGELTEPFARELDALAAGLRAP